MRGDDVGAVAAIDPARYVIGPDGEIAYAEVDPNYTVRPESDDLFRSSTGRGRPPGLDLRERPRRRSLLLLAVAPEPERQSCFRSSMRALDRAYTS